MLGAHQRGRFSHIGRNVTVVTGTPGHRHQVVIGRYVGPSLVESTSVESAQVGVDSPEKNDLVSEHNSLLSPNPINGALSKVATDAQDLLVNNIFSMHKCDPATTSLTFSGPNLDLKGVISSSENSVKNEGCNLYQKDKDLFPELQTAIMVQSLAMVDASCPGDESVSVRANKTNENIQRNEEHRNKNQTTLNITVPSEIITQKSRVQPSDSKFEKPVNTSNPRHSQNEDTKCNSGNSPHQRNEQKICISPRQLQEEKDTNDQDQFHCNAYRDQTNSLRLQIDHSEESSLDNHPNPAPNEEFNYLVDDSDSSPRISDFRSSSPCLSTSSDWTSNSRPSDVTLDYFLRTDDVFDQLTSDDEQVTTPLLLN